MTQTDSDPLPLRRGIRQVNPMASGPQSSSGLPYGTDTNGIWGNHVRRLSSRDNGDRQNVPIGTRNPSNNTPGWPAHSTSRTPPSASPDRTRGGADSNDMSYMTNQLSQLRPFDNPTTYTGAYAGTGNSEGIMNSVNYAAPRGTSSRQSPPSFGASHTPSNSVHSQRGMHNYTQPRHGHTASQQQQQLAAIKQQRQALSQHYQALNQHAFVFNNGQGLDEQSAPLHIRSSPFQLNPTSRTWNHNGATNHASSSSLGGNSDLSITHPMSNRFASNPVDQGSSSNAFTPFSSTWNPRESGSQPLESESDRRMPSQQQYSNYFTGAYNAYLPHGIYPNLEPYIQGIPPTVVPAAHPYQGAGFGHVGVSAHQGHNQSRTVPSQWVADFSALVKVHEKKQHLTLGALSGHVVEASGDQEVSRFIQTKLSTAKSDEKEKLFNEIGPDMVPLMRDLFGNYVIQKLIEHGSQAQKARMVEAAKGHLVELSMNKYGCRVIQKLTDSCLVHQIAELLEEIQDIDVLKSLMQDEYANHVIQKFVQALPAPDFRFITVACQKNARELSTDQNSCRIVQRVLEYAHKDDVRTLLTELHLLMDRLITDSWGNYVAGHIIQNSPEDRESIFNVVMSRLLTLCQNKTASHVVEKCIKYGTPEQRTQIRERLSPINDADNTLYNTLKDQFGNYVVASLLNHLEWGSEERRQFKAEVFAKMTLLKAANTKTLASVQKIFDEDKEREEMERALLQVDVPSPTPELTNETNSPQSDSPPSADASAIEVSPTNPKNTEASLRVRDIDA